MECRHVMLIKHQGAESDEDLKIFGDASAAKFCQPKILATYSPIFPKLRRRGQSSQSFGDATGDGFRTATVSARRRFPQKQNERNKKETPMRWL